MAKIDLTAEPGKPEVILKYVFNAHRGKVFGIYTDPKLIPLWWGPKILTTIVEKMDVTPGGTWRYIQHDARGAEYAFHGVYHSVEPPARIVQTFEYEGMPGHVMLSTTTFEELEGGKTRLTEHSIFQSVEDRDAMLGGDMELGETETMERIAALLAKD